MTRQEAQATSDVVTGTDECLKHSDYTRVFLGLLALFYV